MNRYVLLNSFMFAISFAAFIVHPAGPAVAGMFISAASAVVMWKQT